MESEYYIQKLRNNFGDDLQSLSIKDRYWVIALLSASICKQLYPFQVMAQEQSFFDYLSNSTNVYSSIYDCPVLVIPNVIKFLSESIPATW